MRTLAVSNPFDAPVYYEEIVASTMDVSRMLANNGEPHGTVITAGFQKAGRGRIRGRSWETARAGDLSFTILLRYPRIEDIPSALTLRTGLAAALAIEDFAPALAGRVMIKWPNDLLLQDGGAVRKVTGILAEANGGIVHIGIGVNVGQKEFPEHLRGRATSIGLAAGEAGDPLALLELILAQMYDGIQNVNGHCGGWKSRIEQRLYKKGDRVKFAEGAAGSHNMVSGTLAGVGEGGELLIVPDGETVPRSFFSGELVSVCPQSSSTSLTQLLCGQTLAKD